MFNQQPQDRSFREYEWNTRLATVAAQLIPIQAKVQQLQEESQLLSAEYREVTNAVQKRLDNYEQQLAMISETLTTMEPLMTDMRRRKEDREGMAKTLTESIIGGFGDKIGTILMVLLAMWLYQTSGAVLIDNGVELPQIQQQSPD